MGVVLILCRARAWVVAAALAIGVGACSAGAGAERERPQVVVTTTILGDVVGRVAGGEVDVDVLLPAGADPHEFAPSARQAAAMAEADLLVVSGAGFEAGLAGTIDAAEGAGAPRFAVADHVELVDGDPHFWTDPTLMAGAVAALAERLAAIEGVDSGDVLARGDAYAAELSALDAELEATLDRIPPADRVIVTNHDVLGYFARRYGFEVVGTVIPASSTLAEPSSADIDALVTTIVETGVRAIFAETTSPARLAETLAAEVGTHIEVVELYTESLGEPGSGADTYVGMLRTDARLIVDALT